MLGCVHGVSAAALAAQAVDVAGNVTVVGQAIQRVVHGGSLPSPTIASTQWIVGVRLSAQF
jgi:hypothetical protein